MTYCSKWVGPTNIEVARLGVCQAFRRVIDGEFFQWKLKHGFVEVMGDYNYDNVKALENTFKELTKRFKILRNE